MSDAQTYLAHIAAYEREFAKWEKRGDKIVKGYRDDSASSRKGAKFNVLWSNVQTLKAATFSRMPRPDVSRRFKDQDPVGRVAALMLERALDFEVQHYKDFGATLRQCVYDRFLPGRGVAWVRFEPTFKQEQSGTQAPTLTEDVESQTQVSEVLDFECAPVDYVHWRDFGHNVARTWEEVSVLWRRVYLTRPQLERMGDEFKDLPLDAMPEELSKIRGASDADSVQKRALLYEIWDKDTGKCLFLSKSLSKIVKEQDDPLGLEEFFPTPPPLFSTLTTDSLVPIPDFTLYQDQARELDLISDRIDGLVQQLQVKGCYDASIPELARLFTEGENGSLIPVTNWAAFAEKQGLQGAINIIDILPIAKALSEAYKAFEQIKGQIYELTGISDIIRGETAPSETATAQQIKNSYASMRLKTYQDEVERFAARLLNLKAQIICNHFDEQTICQISGCQQMSPEDQQLVPQALQLLKDNVTRNFSIEIQTDSMVFQDDQQNKQDRTEFLTAVGGYLKQAVEAAQSAPQLAPLMVDLLKFGVRGFKVGKNIEGTIDAAMDAMKQAAQQPPPDPNAAKAQGDIQKAQIDAQADTQNTQAKEQAETQRHMAELQAEAADAERQRQHEVQMAQFQASNDERLKAIEQSHQAQMQAMQENQAKSLAQMQGMLQVILQRMKSESAVEVAEIGAQTTLDAAQISASKQASE